MQHVRAAEPTLLDRAIAWIAPTLAVKRMRARATLAFSRGYDGAKVGRRTEGWRAGSTSANAEALPALSALRNRSRDLVRNNPYAKRAIGALVSGMVGSGFVASLNDARQDVRAAWDAFSRNCDADGQFDFAGLQTLVARCMFESGECLIRFRRRRPEDGLLVPLQLQVLEPDHLDAGKTQSLSGGGRIVSGIEFDALGRRVAYWLFPDHPGDVTIGVAGMSSVRVSADQVIHLYEKTRPGQVRGVPQLAAAMLRMRDLDDYEEAELVRKGIEACFAAFVTSPEGDPSLTPATNDAAGRRIETLGAGMIQYLRPGESVSFGAPTSSDGYGEYTRTQLHAIAAGAGITHEQLTGDLSQVNFSSIRAGLLEFRRMIDTLRWQVFVPMFLQRVQAEFAATALISGAVRAAVPAWEWTAPRWEWVDPLKEAEAAASEIRIGLSSLSEKLRERGLDPEHVFSEIAAERKRLAELGINLDASASPAARALMDHDETTPQPNRRAA